jgi:hypothetical protein
MTCSPNTLGKMTRSWFALSFGRPAWIVEQWRNIVVIVLVLTMKVQQHYTSLVVCVPHYEWTHKDRNLNEKIKKDKELQLPGTPTGSTLYSRGEYCPSNNKHGGLVNMAYGARTPWFFKTILLVFYEVLVNRLFLTKMSFYCQHA